MDWTKTRIISSLDFNADGRQLGELKLKHSSNARALGFYPLPVAVLKNGDGPTLLLTGGVHGDEYEGPATLLRLGHALALEHLRGRIIMFPALNMPAVGAATRCSPLDDLNLNRAFPGNRNGSPTEQIAHLIEALILPACDAAIDIHSGGVASEFIPLSMFYPGDDKLAEKNQALASAFGAPIMLIMGDNNDDRSLNAAALRARVPMFATELGGGGWANHDWITLAEQGICRVMRALDMWRAPVQPAASESSVLRVQHSDATIYAPRDGIFVASARLGDRIAVDQLLGTIYSINEIERSPREIRARVDGQLFCVTRRGLVERGDFLMQVGQ